MFNLYFSQDDDQDDIKYDLQLGINGSDNPIKIIIKGIFCNINYSHLGGKKKNL